MSWRDELGPEDNAEAEPTTPPEKPDLATSLFPVVGFEKPKKKSWEWDSER